MFVLPRHELCNRWYDTETIYYLYIFKHVVMLLWQRTALEALIDYSVELNLNCSNSLSSELCKNYCASGRTVCFTRNYFLQFVIHSYPPQLVHIYNKLVRRFVIIIIIHHNKSL